MQASTYTLEVVVKFTIKYKQVEIINGIFNKHQRGYNAAKHQMQNPQELFGEESNFQWCLITVKLTERNLYRSGK